jgi:hypothetical protein
MSTVKGKLVNAGVANFTGFRVNAVFTLVEEQAKARRATETLGDGTFTFELPETGAWVGPLSFVATGPSGLTLGRLEGLDANADLSAVEIVVAADAGPIVVSPSDDPNLGGIARFNGRVIQSTGDPQRSGLLVVLWGVTPGADEPHAIAVAETANGGYFSGDWPADVLSDAFARVSGGDSIPVPLDGDRLPRRIVLVADVVPEGENDHTSPPRAPSAEDLAAQPDAFANDTGCCTTFTIPNRTVEEVSFQAVVRTTQPEIRGNGVTVKPVVPSKLIDRLSALTELSPAISALVENAHQPATSDAAVRVPVGESLTRTERISRAVGAYADPQERAAALLKQTKNIQLEHSVIAELAREPGGITPLRLVNAQKTSMVRNVRNELAILKLAPIARFELDSSHQADWDSLPYANQATTVAHGHLLTMKQVWRADGYSLGDLLYSMALAPGQQKLVSILDWERRDQATRTEYRTANEQLDASLAHDRDISDIIRSSLREHMDAQSRATTSAVAGAVGGFIGPIVFGAAGGTSKASSTANQASSRDIAASALNQARDRTLQSASTVRGQRASVVQTAREGESVTAQTEAIANNNHCHALTMEYFEVLRHFQVSQEIAAVQECLFIPFEISPFSDAKALRWRHLLQDMDVYFGGAVEDLRPKFDALERKNENWINADVPAARYCDDDVHSIDGEVTVQISIPRPPDKEDHTFDATAWAPYQDLLSQPVNDVWQRYIQVALPEQRAGIWNTRIAPAIARTLIDHLTVDFFQSGVGYTNIGLDSTLVTRFRQNGNLLVTFRSNGVVSGITRAEINRIRLRIQGVAVPSTIETIVMWGSMRYRTDHLTSYLFEDYRIQNDLSVTDMVEIPCPLSKFEKSNPRQKDVKEARLLIDILNERVEYFHRCLWLMMDPNRRFMFLDGVLAPDAGGRSVASVVENRVIGIVGNSLVMPLVPGVQLDPTYEFGRRTPADLRHHYATDPPPPMRISVPTRGVFAEAVMGKCNSCEKIDDTRFWHWDQAPIPDTPTAIEALSVASRKQAHPSVTPSDFPEAIVKYQNVPSAPDPSGLSAAMNLLGTKGLFRDLTGLAMNQENAASALKGVMSAAQSFASQGAALAQQKFLSGQMDRNLDLIKKARDNKQISDEEAQKMTESMFKGALGERRPEAKPVTDNAAVKKGIERVSQSESGQMRITRPGGSVEVKTGNKAATGIDITVEPAVAPIKQKSSMTCWAAAGAMMNSWKQKLSITPETFLDGLGGSWRTKFDADQGLSSAEVKAFVAAMGLSEEGPASYTVEGLGRLLQSRGPLWVISDDDFEANKVVHARIVTAVKGDGSVDGTKVTLAEPLTGTFTEELFTRFSQRLEGKEAVDFGTGIFHW